MELDETLARAESAEAEVDRLNGLLSDAYRRLRGASKGAGAGPAPTCGKRSGLAAVGPVRLGPLSGPSTASPRAAWSMDACATPLRTQSGGTTRSRASADASAGATSATTAAAAAGEAARLRHALAEASRLGQQRAEAQAALLDARAKHAREEGRFAELLAGVRRTAEREIIALREQVEQARGEAGALASQVLSLQGRLAAAQADATLAAEHETAEADRQRERARAAELSRAQITSLRTNFARELAAAQAEGAGAAALRGQLQECHSKLEAAQAELTALRKQAAGARDREASLVAQIVQARTEAAAAVSSRRAAEHASRLQHLQAVDRSLSSTASHSAQLAARAGEAAIAAAKHAVAQAVTVLTAPGGAAHTTRALNATVQRGRELLGLHEEDETGRRTSRSRSRSRGRSRGSCAGLSRPLQPRAGAAPSPTTATTASPSLGKASVVPPAAVAAAVAAADHVPLPREAVVSPLAARLMTGPDGRSRSGDAETRQLLALLTTEREAARQQLARQLLVQAVPAAVDKAKEAVQELLGPAFPPPATDSALAGRTQPERGQGERQGLGSGSLLAAGAPRARVEVVEVSPPPVPWGRQTVTPRTGSGSAIIGRRTAEADVSAATVLPSQPAATIRHSAVSSPQAAIARRRSMPGSFPAAAATAAVPAGAVEGPPPTSRRYGSPCPGTREPLFVHSTSDEVGMHSRDIAASAVAVTLRPPTPEPMLRRRRQ